MAALMRKSSAGCGTGNRGEWGGGMSGGASRSLTLGIWEWVLMEGKWCLYFNCFIRGGEPRQGSMYGDGWMVITLHMQGRFSFRSDIIKDHISDKISDQIPDVWSDMRSEAERGAESRLMAIARCMSRWLCSSNSAVQQSLQWWSPIAYDHMCTTYI